MRHRGAPWLSQRRTSLTIASGHECMEAAAACQAQMCAAVFSSSALAGETLLCLEEPASAASVPLAAPGITLQRVLATLPREILAG